MRSETANHDNINFLKSARAFTITMWTISIASVVLGIAALVLRAFVD